jgi:HSP20 family protein
MAVLPAEVGWQTPAGPARCSLAFDFLLSYLFRFSMRKEVIMNIIRRGNSPVAGYRPRSIEDGFGRLVEHMFEDMLAPLALAGQSWQDEGIAQARMNVTESDGAFDVEIEMPGVKKEDVKVTVEQQRVTVEGEAKRAQEQREGENVVYAERSTRKFMRSFVLPSEVDDSNAQARLEDGILKMTLPKRQGSAATRLTIQ